MGLMKSLANKNQSILNEIFEKRSSVLKRLACIIRNQFNFLKTPLKVFAAQEIIEDDIWDAFVSQH